MPLGERRGPVVFFHPDLGIGGAERLVVDAAVGLQDRNRLVVIYTNHCDPNHCFDECRDGTVEVRVRGDWLIPMSIFSRFTILCAILRHIHLILHITATGELRELRPSAFIVDQLSAGLPLLQFFFPATPILFYCHFPDLLLARGRDSLIKRLYRVPFDWIEEWSMSFAHSVAVNSEFTKDMVDRTLPSLKRHVQTRVVYPCVDTETKEEAEVGQDGGALFKGDKFFLSINRFERKKDIGLAIKAFTAIPESKRKGVRLVLAGGYDPRVSENVEYHKELEELATLLNLEHLTTKTLITALSAPPTVPVLFLLSIPNTLKAALLRSARILIYTPANEHFGIVPLEAMLARTPVLAADSGGPVETVEEDVTGWLRSPGDIPAWTRIMEESLGWSDEKMALYGDDCEKRVRQRFSRRSMSIQLSNLVSEMIEKRRSPPIFNTIVSVAGFALFFTLGLVITSVMSRK